MSSEQGSHFWHMVIQTPNARGMHLGSYQGTRTPKRGQTRLDLFNDVLDEMYQKYPESRGGVVIAFDIQPNKI